MHWNMNLKLRYAFVVHCSVLQKNILEYFTDDGVDTNHRSIWKIANSNFKGLTVLVSSGIWEISISNEQVF